MFAKNFLTGQSKPWAKQRTSGAFIKQTYVQKTINGFYWEEVGGLFEIVCVLKTL